MGKVKMKHFLNIIINKDKILGKETKLMVWFPYKHRWFRPEEEDLSQFMDKKTYKKFLNTKVLRIGLRNDMLDYIAVFLEDEAVKK